MFRLVLQRGRAGTTVVARSFHASRQFNRTILAAPQRITLAQVVADAVLTLAVHARLVFLTFVDFLLAEDSLVAQIAFAGVRVDLKWNSDIRN